MTEKSIAPALPTKDLTFLRPRSIAPDAHSGFPSPWGLPELCAIAQVAGPAILYLPGTQIFRVPIRFSVFGISLAGLILCLRCGRIAKSNPAWRPLVIAAAYMTLMILHPTTNTMLAGLAQVGMHLAVVAPIFWAPDYFLGDYKRLARLLTILWILNGASAMVGILQVRDPNTWLPAEFSSVETKNKSRISALSYRASDNQLVVRPPGLGDAPGAACGAGLFVASVGIAFIGLPTSNWRRMIGLGMAMLGISVIFLSHVRSSLLVLAGSAIIFTALLAAQKRYATALVLVGAMVSCGLGSFIYASSVGGQATTARFATLLEDDPTTVLEHSGRLSMTTNALDTLIFEYPLGAGLGRWGMMRSYFGNEGNLDSPGIWAEVQLAAWALDGGVILLSLYLIGIAVAVHRLIRLSLIGDSDLLRRWAAVVLMLSIAPVALIFSWTPFNSQAGIQFWLLIGALEGVAQRGGDETEPPPQRRERMRTTTRLEIPPPLP